jgi:NADH:ubiquinone oxidoreductase subunit D
MYSITQRHKHHGILQRLSLLDERICSEVAFDPVSVQKGINSSLIGRNIYSTPSLISRSFPLSQMAIQILLADVIENEIQEKISQYSLATRALAREAERIVKNSMYIARIARHIDDSQALRHSLEMYLWGNELYNNVVHSDDPSYFIKPCWNTEPVPEKNVQDIQSAATHIVELSETLLKRIENKAWVRRLSRFAVITKQTAISHALNGPILRATGIRYDLRHKRPVYPYTRIPFKVSCGKLDPGIPGDAWNRVFVRLFDTAVSATVIGKISNEIPKSGIIPQKPEQEPVISWSGFRNIDAASGEISMFCSVEENIIKEFSLNFSHARVFHLVDEHTRFTPVENIDLVINSFDLAAEELAF